MFVDIPGASECLKVDARVGPATRHEKASEWAAARLRCLIGCLQRPRKAAAVEDNVLAGDVAAVLRGKKRRHGAEFLSRAETPCGDVLHAFLVNFIEGSAARL